MAATPIGERTYAPGGTIIPRFRTLEARLRLGFLLLAVVPALVLSLIATGLVTRAIDPLQNPGVEESVTYAPRLYAELVDRCRTDALPLLEELPGSVPRPAEEAAIRERLAEAGFDFAAWETPHGVPAVVAAGEVRRKDLPDRDDWELLHGVGRPESLRGTTLRFFREGDEGDPGRVVGISLSPELGRAMGSVGRDFGRYLQLERFERLQKLMWAGLLAIVFVLAVVAANVAARITARRISRPVRELAEAADRVAAGDLSRRADVRADGEIGDLVSAFNRMTGQLARSREELIRMERIAAWREVARRVAHEIRNPLTPVKLAVHRLRSRVPDDAEAAECLRSIGEEVDNLARISEAFSEFAKMPEARFGRTDLAQVAKGVAELFRDAAAGVTVTYEGPDTLPLVADRDHLRRAATNLVKNAVEALGRGGRGGEVRMRIVVEGSRRARLEVSDDGPGIPETIRETLFRPGVSGQAGGSGLGLAMVQRIATDHRGTLEWSEQDPGTRFVLKIPLDLPEDA